MEKILEWAPLVNEIAPLYGLPPVVVLAVIAVETGRTGDAGLVNPRSQATGLMQVMPREAGEVFADRPSSEELKDPRTNIEWGCKILQYYLDRKASLYSALYQYSGGTCWESWEDYGQKYWGPFRRAQFELEELLAKREDKA